MNKSGGFSLVELMLAMLIGLIITGGVMSIYISTRDTQRVSDDQLQMVADARFAIETIGFDIRHAGSWGGTNLQQDIHCQKDYDNCSFGDDMPKATGDCVDYDYINLRRPVFGLNDNISTYASTCATNNYKALTDVLEVRYADPTAVATVALAADTAYARTNVKGGKLFKTGAAPSIPDHDHYKWEPFDNTNTVTQNYPLVSHVYYVSSETDPGDNIPSLRRASLVAGPQMDDEVLISGVEDFQVQYGVPDTTTNPNDNKTVVSYVTADNITTDVEWQKVSSIKIWLLMRSERKDRDGIMGSRSFNYAGKSADETDGYRRFLISSVIELKNTNRLGEQTAAGS